jgi:hypothetical protein
MGAHNGPIMVPLRGKTWDPNDPNMGPICADGWAHMCAHIGLIVGLFGTIWAHDGPSIGGPSPLHPRAAYYFFATTQTRNKYFAAAAAAADAAAAAADEDPAAVAVTRSIQ